LSGAGPFRRLRTRRTDAAVFGVAAAVASTVAAPARANERFPFGEQLIVAPSDSRTLVLRTTFGLLVTHDGGNNWDWICESAVGYGATDADDPVIAITQGGALIAATDVGLAVSPDTGCSWHFANAVDMADVTVWPQNPHAVLAISSSFEAGDPNAPSPLVATTDDGATWAPYGTSLPSYIHPQTIEVAASDPHRVYVSGLHVTLGFPQGALLVSYDDGHTWTENVIPINAFDEEGVYIGGVDATNADRVYLRVPSAYPGRLVVTDDAGKTSRTVLSTQSPMSGFALSPDGRQVYVGSADGVFLAGTAYLDFWTASPTPIFCLAATGGLLYGCSREYDGGFFLGTSTDDGASFTPTFNVPSLRGPLQCAANTATAQCASQWPALLETFATDMIEPPSPSDDAGPLEGGTQEAGTAADAGPAASGSTSSVSNGTARCSCRAAGARAAGGGVAAILAIVPALAAFLGRRRQKK
jgi:photosystem II stability/assembly factor-like uncharacterized protein